MFLLAGASAVVTLLAQSAGHAVKSAAAFPWSERLTNMVAAYVSYLGKTVFPVRLAVLYPYSMNRWSAGWLIAACLLLAVISLAAGRAAHTRPAVLVGWLWYLGTLVPVIGFVQVGSQAMADRYTYVPLIGIFVMLAWSLPAPQAAWQRHALGVAWTVVLAVLMSLSWMQTAHWRNSLALFEHAVAVTDDNEKAHNNLAIALSDLGRYDEALVQCRTALRINPGSTAARNTLGLVVRAQQNQALPGERKPKL